jgi:multimeric flavodoxin WrbA
MNILGILGSARKRGNTEFLIDIALEEAKGHGATVARVSLRDLAIAPCDGCGKCQKSGKCVVKDDMEEIYRKMLEADGILWATPVYFWSMTGQTKIVMDRTYALTFPRLRLANKVGGLITVASIRGCMSTAHIFHNYFRYNAMFFAETVTGFASAKGAIKESESTILSVKEMISQMVLMIQAGLKHPEAFDLPLHRYVKKKYGLP